jgi:hypothetical protein
MNRSHRYRLGSAAFPSAARRRAGLILRSLGLGVGLVLVLTEAGSAQSCYGRPDTRHLSVEVIDVGGRTSGGVHVARGRWFASAWWGQIRTLANRFLQMDADDRGVYLTELRYEALGLRGQLGSQVPAGAYTFCFGADATWSTDVSARENRLYLDPFGRILDRELDVDLGSAGFSTLTAQLEAAAGRPIGSRVWSGVGAIVRRSWFMPNDDRWTVREGAPIDARVFLALGARVVGPIHIAARYTLRVWESRIHAFDRASEWLETTIGVLF